MVDHSIENCLAMLSIKLPQKNFFGIKWLCYPRRDNVMCSQQRMTKHDCHTTLRINYFMRRQRRSNFMRQQFSRWGAPKEQRDEVAADIWELAHKWMQALQTERTQVREPQLFSWNDVRQCLQTRHPCKSEQSVVEIISVISVISVCCFTSRRLFCQTSRGLWP